MAQRSEAAGTLYILPAGTANNIGNVTAAVISSGASAGAFADTTITISANHTGVIDATPYQVYAVDEAGKFLPISDIAFTADLTTPIENCTSLAFDGLDDYVAISDNDDTLSAFTIETWVKWEVSSPMISSLSYDIRFLATIDTLDADLSRIIMLLIRAYLFYFLIYWENF
ncbi:hypothetical protein [Candidatus Formimonas warabiya]|uniref:Uncharacterized protein n=1 Tax=Formimonas warabiya TaxID=1761012 RepID=A0A3G1KT57_FORW1|nr:hypothetical protein [Candidatus Formimonas warabiya]ATW25610.1 hypothetical protein DCMF_13335 [Candidatus Formimonas warabiya]